MKVLEPAPSLPIALVGDDIETATVDGPRRYVCFDAAASTGALPAVAGRVSEFLPQYSSVHRGAGHKSQLSTAAYEDARTAALRFARRDPARDIAIFCRNTTDAINHLAYRLRLEKDDVVVTTVVEHHANLLPWMRVARCHFVECGAAGTFEPDDVAAVLDDELRRGVAPALLAVTGASNVTGWLPPIDEIIAVAHDRGVRVVVDAAQLAPHRPMPADADFVVWSAHKMYAPFGVGVLAGPKSVFLDGDPFLHGGGAVDLVDLDEVVWTDPPAREEAGSPNVIGAVALQAAIDELETIGWPALMSHESALSGRLRAGLAAIDGVRRLGPAPGVESLAVVPFVVDDVHHALVAARLSWEFGIGVRHGCFCAHPYLTRLLGLSHDEVAAFRANVLAGNRTAVPGAIRASAGIFTSEADVDALVAAVAAIVDSKGSVDYVQDPTSGDYLPLSAAAQGFRSGDAPGCKA